MDYNSVFLKQNMMRRVLLALIPPLVIAIYLFGLRALTLLLVVTIAGVLTEYLMLRYGNQQSEVKISEAVLVTSVLFTLTLPPAAPYWVATIGIIFGVLFAKAVFGGFGKNVFNPALVGRCFIYISFPGHMTVTWSQPFLGFPGGFVRFSGGIDAITSATPMSNIGDVGYLQLLLGNIAGSLGETSAVLILLAAAYLIYTKTASWKIMVASTISFVAVSTFLFFGGVISSNPLLMLLSGGFLFATVFMATDPISAPASDSARLIYGILIGTLTVVIRAFSTFTGGIMFAILIGNTFAPLLDMKVKEYMARRKVA